MDLDGLVICSENAKHVTLVTTAAGRVKHILCEKPLATTRKDALAMLAACARHGTQLQVAFPVRFLAPILELKQRLEAGAGLSIGFCPVEAQS
jgi:predicted dehydrogenase